MIPYIVGLVVYFTLIIAFTVVGSNQSSSFALFRNTVAAAWLAVLCGALAGAVINA